MILQYFAFLRLGREGYERVVQSTLANARALAKALAAVEGLEIVNDGSLFPIVVARARDEGLDLTLLSHRLRERGWIVPAYTLPADAQHVTVLRMVVKENLSRDMVEMLAHDVRACVRELREPGGAPAAHRQRERRRPHC